MANAAVFCEDPEQLHPHRVKKLRGKILKDAAKKTTDDEIIKFSTYADFTSCLPPLRNFPAEFRLCFTDAIIDEDMKDDLQRRDVINWCSSTKLLYPIKTTADGNCLLHAVSKFVWGIDDRELFLRRLLYLNISTDTGRIRKRWLYNQRNSTDLQRANLRFNTEEYMGEWDSVIRATEDATQTGNHTLPYSTLESVHLYVLANVFRRPIIVYADRLARNVFGQSLQDDHIGGIYLPLEWNQAQCDKSPILIGYNINHFAPLLMEDNAQRDREQAVPIVSNQLASLVVRYLLPDEEPQCMKLLQDYLEVKEVVHNGTDGVIAVTCARVIHKSLPDKYNVIDQFRRDSEMRFRRLMDQEAGYRPNEHVNITRDMQIQPFQFKVEDRHKNRNADHVVVGNNVIPSRAINFVGNQQVVVTAVKQKQTPAKCLTLGCQMYGIPEMAHLCSKCFKDFTIQYNRQEEAFKKINKPPSIETQETRTVPRPTGQEAYHDLSMMGEDCKCGFKCSTETYPYCHECFPGRDKKPRFQEEPQQADISLLPDNCQGKDCTYKCSKATYPYCHECYERYSIPRKQLPTAPPPSVPMEVDPVSQPGDPNLQLRIQAQNKKMEESRKMNVDVNPIPNKFQASQMQSPAMDVQQTVPMDIRAQTGKQSKKCKTSGCTNPAVKGNDGVCDDCYNISLFGEGNNAAFSPPDETVLAQIRNLDKGVTKTQCSTKNCTEETKDLSTRLCLECFLKGESVATGDATQRQEKKESINMAMNISIPESPMEEKILNSQSEQRLVPTTPPLHLSGPPLSSSLTLKSPLPMETTAHVPVMPVPMEMEPMDQQTTTGRSGTYRKYICSTPGCEGIRIDNPNGLCFSCSKAIDNIIPAPLGTTRSMLGAPVTSPAEAESGQHESNLEISCSPCLTEQQEKELNPVITSSRQKVKCASPHCSVMIYPPKKLCDECSIVLEKHRATTSLEDNKKSVHGFAKKCRTPGCQFFGSAETDEFCSSCYKSGAGRRTAPIASSKPIPTVSPTNRHKSAPLKTVVPKPTGRQCIEPSCSRFGDPSQADRCYQHYKEAMDLLPPNMSDKSLTRYLNGVVDPSAENRPKLPDSHNVAGTRPQSTPIAQTTAPTITEPVPNDKTYLAAMGKVESSRKSNQLCKNNPVKGCQNYGNSTKKGYCNTCYPEIQRLESSRQPLKAGQNQFG